jgi:two-component system cell cycle response regulator
MLSSSPVAAEAVELDERYPSAISHRRVAIVIGGIALASALFACSPALGHAAGWWREGAYLGTLLLFVGLSLQLAAALHGMARRTWLLLALTGVVWLATEAGSLLTRALAGGEDARFWLVLGIGSLVSYGLLLIGGLRYAARSSPIEWALGLLDASLLLLALATPWMQFVVLERVPDADHTRLLPAVVMPAASGMLLLMGMLLAYSAPSIQPSALLVLSALGAAVAGDTIASLRLLHGSTRGDAALVVWELRVGLMCVAAALSGGSALVRRRWLVRPGVLRLIVVVLCFGLTLGTATFALSGGQVVGALAVGSYAVAALIARFLLHAFSRQRDAERLTKALREQEQLAVVDPLTGLFNRRFFDAQLKLELDRAARSQGSVGLLVIDLDHFKRTNDTYGHLAGDDILRGVARRLLAAVRNGDIVARYGGEEFVVLLPGGGALQLREIGERCRLAVSEQPLQLTDGRELRTTVSVGGASWPDDALSVRDLFHSADIALYRAKELGRDRVELSEAHAQAEIEPLPAVVPASEDARPVGAPAASTPQPRSLGAPSMARWARLAAKALGLDPGAQERCAVAARFHDVGKYVVPQGILGKQGPLTRLEWEVVRMHPEYGAWLIELVPEFRGVGQIIREHHERVDGGGYPAGKRQDEISSEARIVAVCDAWSAMRNGRPYARAKSESEARAELLAGRGSQFDARIVETFLMFDETDVKEEEGEEEPLPAALAHERQAPVA